MAETHPSEGGAYGSLASVLASRALAALVIHFVLHPASALHFRAIQRVAGVASRSLQHELARLENLGLVRREPEGRRVRYRAVTSDPRWSTFEDVVRDFAHPAELLRVAMGSVPGVEAAFIYGSFAGGSEVHAQSDVDVIAVGARLAEQEARTALAEEALEVAGLIGREVNVVPWTPDRLRTRDGSGFVRGVLEAQKIWLWGREAATLEMEATA